MDTTITANNGKTISLNRALVEKMGLDQNQVNKILVLHQEKHDVFDAMKETDDKKTLRNLAKLVTQIEFDLQEAWGFQKDSSFHEWYMVPKCTCPKLDNQDRKGTPYNVYSSTCPIHFEKIAEQEAWEDFQEDKYRD